MFTNLPRRASARRLGAAALAAALAAPVCAPACDVCAVYVATELRDRRMGLRLGVAEQFTRFATLQDDGKEVPNPAGQFMNSSITQLLLGYNVTPRLGLQLNLPIIARTFRRPEGGGIERGNETGFGDLSLLANVLAYSHTSERSVFQLTLLGGLKLPSGNPDRLAEELEEGHHHGGETAAGEAVASHTGGPEPAEPGPGGAGEIESGIHGHDLALGSGSVDGIVGGQLFWSWQRLYLTAAGQYAIRTEGAFDYRYANDLSWQTGPGFFVLLTHDYSLGVQALFSGETKGKDSQAGETLDDTGITALYLGPVASFTWGPSLGAELMADLPLVVHNTALQIVPDFRVRGGVVWRF